MVKYALIAALSLSTALALVLFREVVLRKDAEAVSASLSRSLAAAQKRAADGARAAQIATVARQRAEARADKAAETILMIREGGYDDALPDDLRDLLNSGVQ